MQRFYLPEINIQDNIFILKESTILSQLIKVLRVKVWEEIIFFNWQDNIDYLFTIENIDKREIRLYLQKEIPKVGNENYRSSKQEVNLFQALPNKLSKIESILQKWVEVWLKSFTFFSSNRSQKIPLSDNKIKRFKKIIIEAVEQSNQNIIPKLQFNKTLSTEGLNPLNKKEITNKGNNNCLNLFFHTSIENSLPLKDINISESDIINILVWPEWWWDNLEIWDFIEKWFKNIYLWTNILRTETVSSVVWFFLKQK